MQVYDNLEIKCTTELEGPSIEETCLFEPAVGMDSIEHVVLLEVDLLVGVPATSAGEAPTI